MKLNELPTTPANRKERNRKGRGMATGNGKTAGRGMKGQKSRSGGYHKVGFEGGQMPLQRRLPKRGFTNLFKKEYELVNVRDLDRFEENSEVNAELLKSAGLLSKKGSDSIKLLADGEVTKALTVYVDKASKTAVAKVEAVGGKVVLSAPAAE